MENLVSIPELAQRFAGKSVLVTGHSGFKGSWLTSWLVSLGARVTGFSLRESSPGSDLFCQLGLRSEITHCEGDIRDRSAISDIIRDTQPDVVFHLAAQPLVRQSYTNPVATFETNVIGTVNVLDALRQLSKPCVAISVTTDKCYENREWLHAYREEDPMGGHDPYSASKGCAELAISSYRNSFFQNGLVSVASARAGNVIGGGDRAPDRIVPDCIRAYETGEAVVVRSQSATRPWQHVLEPLSGYLVLAANLAQAAAGQHDKMIQTLSSAFNFGPDITANRTVLDLVREIASHIPIRWEAEVQAEAPHEAGRLNLATDKAFHLLGWQPIWNFKETVSRTVAGYEIAINKLHGHMEKEIRAYTADATEVLERKACAGRQ